MSQHPLPEPSIADVLNAQKRIRPYVFQVTPRLSETLTMRLGRDVWLIPESLQRTGSFKFRGALNRMLIHQEKGGGPIITASSGNHAIGITVAAKITGTESMVVVPEGVSEAKLRKLHDLGARVLMMGAGFDEAEDRMFEYATKHGIEVVNSFDFDVIAGHATAALEAYRQLPELSTLLAPVASGGLLAASATVARAAAPSCALIGVQTKVWPAMYESLRARRLANVSGGHTIADGLAGNAARSALPFQIIRRDVSDISLVSEHSIQIAIRHALVHEHLVLEGAGAATLAAVLDGLVPPGDGPLGVILSGGNATEEVLRKALCA